MVHDPDQFLMRFMGNVELADMLVRLKEPRGPLDEDIIEDADSRHEQFTEEADRWRDDRPGERA